MRNLIKCIAVSMVVSVFALGFTESANAARTGSACKKVNSKSWDGNSPIVCKKNKSGKLVWSKFSTASPVKKTYALSVQLIEVDETLPSSNDQAVWFCDNGGKAYKDIYAATGIEVRDGNSNLLATGVLGSATVVDDGALGSCVFQVTLDLKEADFYQIKIGRRYDKSFSFQEMVNENWKLELIIG